MTLPTFSPELEADPHPNQGPGFTCIQCPHKFYAKCEACGEDGVRDSASKLCRACWRVAVLGHVARQLADAELLAAENSQVHFSIASKAPEMVRLLRLADHRCIREKTMLGVFAGTDDECPGENGGRLKPCFGCQVTALLKDLPEVP